MDKIDPTRRRAQKLNSETLKEVWKAVYSPYFMNLAKSSKTFPCSTLVGELPDEFGMSYRKLHNYFGHLFRRAYGQYGKDLVNIVYSPKTLQMMRELTLDDFIEVVLTRAARWKNAQGMGKRYVWNSSPVRHDMDDPDAIFDEVDMKPVTSSTQ